MMTFMNAEAQSGRGFFERQEFRIGVSHPALDLGYLLVGEMHAIVAAFLHVEKHLRRVLLLLARPCEDTVENGLNLLFCHMRILRFIPPEIQ